jgi:hypothetical protein
VSTQQAKGYGVLTFNGDIVQAKDSPLDPLIDLETGDTTGFIDLPLDNNGNVANGIYGFEYVLRLDSSGSPLASGTITGTTTLTSPSEWLFDVLPVGSSIDAGSSTNNNVSAISVVGSDAVITLGTATTNGFTLIYANNVESPQFSATYPYSGCTQTTADVGFIYDCEYGNSGTWSVSNATVLGATEIVTSLNCVINYPSWTSSNPLFNPQVITTVLPYPTLPGDNTPLATGTYSVSLSQQIQQTQASGLVVLYNNSVIKEFAVSCAGSLCGLTPCMENLRAAHATELVRNRISKYQVFVDNVALYYIEAMNYRSCGELDRYRDTINLIQAQLDASGCDCACCDDNSYYWVSNNSANSIIDEILANFQFRLYTGPGAPSASEVGVELGALWQDTTTGILYRCTLATPGSLTWALYYDPSVVYPTGAANGLSISGSDVVLGGSLTGNTTIDLNTRKLTFLGTTGDVEILSTIGTALSVEGTSNALDILATTNTAATLQVERVTDNDVATNLVLRTSVSGGVGANGLGSSIEFKSEGAATTITTSSIESVVTNASTQRGELKFNVKAGGPNVANSFTLNDDLSATLPFYGDGNYTGSPTYYLGVDVDGNVIESNPVTSASNGLSVSGNDVVIGGSLDAATTIDLSTQDLTFSDGNVLFSGTGTQKVTLSSTSNTLQVTGGVGAVSIDGTTNALDATSTTNTAARLTVNTTTNNAAATNLSLRTTVDGGSGDDGVGSSIQFATESSAGTPVTTASIESVLVSATSPVQANLNFKTRSSSSSSLLDRLTLNSDGSATLPSYGGGTITGTPAHSLSVDSSGNVIETTLVPKVYAAKITKTNPVTYVLTPAINTTGGTLTLTYSGASTSYVLTSSNGAFTTGKTFAFCTLTVTENGAFGVFEGSPTQLILQTVSTAFPTGYDGLENAYIKIEIYP